LNPEHGYKGSLHFLFEKEMEGLVLGAMKKNWVFVQAVPVSDSDKCKVPKEYDR